MADSIGQAYVQILPTTKGFSKSLSSELGGGGGGLVSAGKSMGSKLIAGLAAAGIGVAIGKFVSNSVNAGGELQQNLGGTEAVFGKFADNIQKTADEAYKNMGMSASDYMATANKMGSLFQGSGVSQQKSLQMTTDAMQRAADVASVMGIDTQTAMDSIAGAAKGNFTMMDNLGVAMNATTLQAYALEKGINFDWKTADNAQKAELAMKMFMDRTSQYEGNFAKESEKTLTGSIGAMKSLVTDLMGNLAIGADITPQISALLETAKNFLIQNLLPMISNVITGVANNASQLATVLTELATSIASEILTVAPTLLQAGITILTEFGKGLIEGIPQMMPMVTQVITDLAIMLTEPDNLEALIMTGVNLILALADGFIQALPVIASAMPTIIMNIVTALIRLAPQLWEAAKALLKALGDALINSAYLTLKAIAELGRMIMDKFKETKFFQIGSDIINGIVEGLNSTKEKLFAKIREIANLLPETVKKLLGIASPSKVFEDIAKWIPIGMAEGIEKSSHYVDDAMNDMLGGYGTITSRGVTMDISTRDNTSAYSYAGIYQAVKEGASESTPIVILNNRVLSRELKGMGVSFA